MAFSPTKPRDYGTTKAVVARLIDDAGGAKQAAFIVERAASHVYAYADPDVDAQMTLDMARRLAAATDSNALAEDAAALAGGVFMPIRPDESALSDIAASNAHEHGRVMTGLFAAMADKHVSSREARDLLPKVDDHLRSLVAMRAKLVSIIDEGK